MGQTKQIFGLDASLHFVTSGPEPCLSCTWVSGRAGLGKAGAERSSETPPLAEGALQALAEPCWKVGTVGLASSQVSTENSSSISVPKITRR